MVDPARTRRLGFRAMFFGACMVVVFFKLLPLSIEPATVPAPDLLFLICAAFVLRRPSHAPALLIVIIMLIADILFLRPLGLWPAFVLVGTEFLRGQIRGQSELELPIELIMVPAVFATLMTLNALVYTILSIPHPSAVQTLFHIVMTALAYPFVILFVHFILRIRRARPGDIEIEGPAV